MGEEAPNGLVLEPELIDEAEERRLLASFAELDFRPVVIRGRTSLRTAAHFGLRY
ncbi:MAG: alpha-ketoglutarate-dependent dioxygenase AlkB, partial [Actinobacteria bacterium]|nr:alpha-ketoglutarate-dependent dioxygenase AlkB [Actinomycetota bacterium]